MATIVLTGSLVRHRKGLAILLPPGVVDCAGLESGLLVSLTIRTDPWGSVAAGVTFHPSL